MVLLTTIARLADGLPLATSIQEDKQSGHSLQEYQMQAKGLCRKLKANSPSRCSIETGPLIFHYLIEKGVVYLALCEQSFSKRVAFAYLEDLENEFDSTYGNRVGVVSRPYSFIEFYNYIQKTKKNYTDSRARRNLGAINTELQDVQRIMVENIDDVLQRGEATSTLDKKAKILFDLSQKYKNFSKFLDMKSTYAKIGATAIIIVVLFLIFKFLTW